MLKVFCDELCGLISFVSPPRVWRHMLMLRFFVGATQTGQGGDWQGSAREPEGERRRRRPVFGKEGGWAGSLSFNRANVLLLRSCCVQDDKPACTKKPGRYVCSDRRKTPRNVYKVKPRRERHILSRKKMSFMRT